MRKRITFFVPSNRSYDDGRPRAMDGLNEIIRQGRTNRYYGAECERQNLEWVAWYALQAMRKANYQPMTKSDRQRCDVLMTFVEVNDSRDVANVIGGCSKYALDALTARHRLGVGAIWDDSSKWLREFVPQITIDKSNPGIWITIQPLEA